MKSEVVSFRTKLAAGQSITLKERVKADGQLTEIRVRFYPGNQLALKVKPYVKHKGNKDEDVFTYAAGTDSLLAGDDDYFVFPVTVDVENDDEVVVFAQNTETTFTYSVVVDMVLQYQFDEGDYRGRY